MSIRITRDANMFETILIKRVFPIYRKGTTKYYFKVINDPSNSKCFENCTWLILNINTNRLNELQFIGGSYTYPDVSDIKYVDGTMFATINSHINDLVKVKVNHYSKCEFDEYIEELNNKTKAEDIKNTLNNVSKLFKYATYVNYLEEYETLVKMTINKYSNIFTSSDSGIILHCDNQYIVKYIDEIITYTNNSKAVVLTPEYNAILIKSYCDKITTFMDKVVDDPFIIGIRNLLKEYSTAE